jgi:hypothetical protein
MFGTVRELADGRVELRFERWFPHSRDKVWRALTSTAELLRWELIQRERPAGELVERLGIAQPTVRLARHLDEMP